MLSHANYDKAMNSAHRFPLLALGCGMDDATMKAFLSVGRSVLIVGLLLLSHQVNAETPDDWIALGARVHSGFGVLVAVGVKIGLDAVKRLNAGPGDLKVTYYDGDKSPCACAADGIAIATYSSVGQRNFIISPKQAPNEAIAVAVIPAPERRPWLQIHNSDIRVSEPQNVQ